MQLLQHSRFRELFLNQVPMLDVRAEVEFTRGHFPHTVNLPILSDAERAAVGLCYKEQGSDAALVLGHTIVSGAVKEKRVNAWLEFFTRRPDGVLYCARGGQRSSISQSWIADAGLQVPRIEGGYKALRQYALELLEELPASAEFLVLSGYTGSGKTRVLRTLAERNAKVLDLEALANHRGSTFGGYAEPQPAQATFENFLAVKLLHLSTTPGPIFVEDESQSIGRLWIHDSFFMHVAAAPIIVLKQSFDQRVACIIEDYVAALKMELLTRAVPDLSAAMEQYFLEALQRIRKRLGSERTAEIAKLIQEAVAKDAAGAPASVHEGWIAQLLRHYYDPCYEYHLRRVESRVQKVMEPSALIADALIAA